ncbi:MAG TPA: hypothetical protein VFJ30_02705, partial [Phycisphaerae bacterium]|nr:hypothetical protein [Phycisphaerae bacterium]
MTRGTAKLMRWLLPAVAAAAAAWPGIVAAQDAADDDWLGKAPPGRPVRTDVNVLKEKSTVLDVTFAHLDFGKSRLMPEPVFSDDGKYLYLLDMTGRLRKIEIATWKQVQCLPLATGAFRLRRAGSWLMVSTANDERHWLIEPATLRVHHAITTQGTGGLCSGPRVDYAYSSQSVYDIRTGRRTLRDLRNMPKGQFLFNAGDSVITPDGKYLFSYTGHQLSRWRISGRSLLFEQTQAPMDMGSTGAALLAGNGEYVYQPFQRKRTPGNSAGMMISVFKANDLREPAHRITAGRFVDVDKQGMWWSLGDSMSLGGYLFLSDPDGVELRKYKWPWTSTIGLYTTARMHPDGSAIINIHESHATWAELPKVSAANGRAAPGQVTPKPEPVQGAPLAGTRRQVDGAAVTDVALSPRGLVPDVLLSDDGTGLLTLSADGTLRRFHLPEVAERMRLEIGAECSFLARSAEGLVVVVKELQELWVIDEGTFEVKRRMPAAGAIRVATSPARSIAYVLDSNGLGLQPVDLKTGKAGRNFRWVPRKAALSRETSGWAIASAPQMRMTPDGKWLIGRSSGGISRVWCGSEPMVFHESTACSSSGEDLLISPDGRYVLADGLVKAWPVEGFAIAALDPPGFNLVPAMIDSFSKRVYGCQGEVLVALDAEGKKELEFVLPVKHPKAGMDEYRRPTLTHLLPGVYENRGHRQMVLDAQGSLVVLTGYHTFLVAPPASRTIVSSAPYDPLWLGAPDRRREITATLKGLPSQNTKALEVRRLKRDGIEVVAMPCLSREIVESLPWTPDGKSFYLLDRTGLLRRITAPGFEEIARLMLPQPCRTMAMSKLGLLVGAANWPELYLLDAETLQVKWKMTFRQQAGSAAREPFWAKDIIGIITSPGSDLAFIRCDPWGATYRLELATGKSTGPVGVEAPWKDKRVRYAFPMPPPFPEFAQITPDGRWMLLSTPEYGICRFDLNTPVPRVVQYQKPLLCLHEDPMSKRQEYYGG